MVKLKRSQIRAVDEIFDMKSGYVLDFSNRTFAEFFEDEFGIDIDDAGYETNGTSKANRLRTLLAQADLGLVEAVLRKLLDHKQNLSAYSNPFVYDDESANAAEKSERDGQRLDGLILELQSSSELVATQELQRFAEVINFDTVNRDLARARDAARTDPEDAITSACSTLESVFRSILVELGEPLPSKKDIQGLYGAVKGPLGLSTSRNDVPDTIRRDVLTVLSGLQSAIQGIGALRTHAGDAHGRERGFSRIDSRIAVLGINSANTLALFLLETWVHKYPNVQLKKL